MCVARTCRSAGSWLAPPLPRRQARRWDAESLPSSNVELSQPPLQIDVDGPGTREDAKKMGCGASSTQSPPPNSTPTTTNGPEATKAATTTNGPEATKAVLVAYDDKLFEGVDPRVVECFKLIDKNGDGSLSKTELLVALRKQEGVRTMLGLKAVKFEEDKPAFEAAFTKMDADANQTVTPQELNAFLKDALTQSGPPALELSLQRAIGAWGKSVFEQFDTDKNGVLDNKELGRALKALPKTKPTNAPPDCKYMGVEEMIAAMDADGSGAVDLDEWCSNLSKCAGLAAALAESVSESGILESFRSFEQQKAKREREIAEIEGKMATAEPEELAKLAEEMAEYERQVASLAKKIEEAASNAAARAGASAACMPVALVA